MCACISLRVLECVCLCMFLCVSVYPVCMCQYVNVCVCIHVFVCGCLLSVGVSICKKYADLDSRDSHTRTVLGQAKHFYLKNKIMGIELLEFCMHLKAV